jgi:HD-like signal output (HDOD) protein
LSAKDSLESLPTLPTIVYELSRVISDPMSSMSDIEKIMANDPAMTAQVLQLANSAYYAIPGGVSSLSRAIAHIGFDAIHQLVLAASIIKSLDAKASPHFEPKEFWKHCLGVGMASEIIAKFVRYKNPSDLFTCGLIHDLGKIALYLTHPEVFAAILLEANRAASTFAEAEASLKTKSHTEIGCELTLHWKLPTLFQVVTEEHHRASPASRRAVSAEMHQVIDIVFLANLLIHALHFGQSGHEKVLGVPQELLDRLLLNKDRLKELVGEIKIATSSADSFLKIIGGS